MATKMGNNAGNKLNGTSLADKLFGKGGNDKINGKGGNDNIDGGKGRDTIDGGAGDDWIVGGAGNDSLKGGTGKDVFSFKAGSGIDTIKDFSVTDDKLAIQKGLNGIQTAADVLGKATETTGADGKTTVTIDLGNNSKIVLSNVSLEDLQADPAAHFAVI